MSLNYDVETDDDDDDDDGDGDDCLPYNNCIFHHFPVLLV